MPGLPIDALLPDLRRTLAGAPAAVLQAPPGAGKTTRVPLALLDAAWLGDRKIVLLEPRRLAARAAARFVGKRLMRDDRLLVSHRAGRSQLNAYLDDYAFLADGLLDIYVCAVVGINGFTGHNELFINNGDGTFSDISEESGIAQHPGKGMGMVCADYDNDGDLDYITNNLNDPPFVYRNTTVDKWGNDRNYLRIRLLGEGANSSAFGSKIELWHGDQYQFQEYFLFFCGWFKISSLVMSEYCVNYILGLIQNFD